MWKMNVQSAVISSHIAVNQLKSKGLFILTGALSIYPLQGTPSMIGYGMSKAATHQLLNSISDTFHEKNRNDCAIGILPNIIDTKTPIF